MKPIFFAPLVAIVLAGAGLGVYFAAAGAGSGEEVPAVQATATPTPTPAEQTTATPTAEPTPTPAPTDAPTPSPTAASGDWLTYTDATYGYSFDYPATWYLFPPGKNGGDVTLYSYDFASVPPEQAGMPVPRDKLKVFFWVAEGVDQPLEEWLAEGRTGPGQISPPTVLSQNAATLGGKEGLAEVVEEADGAKSISYYVPLGGGRVFVVNAGPADSQVRPQFETVLGNIRFSP